RRGGRRRDSPAAGIAALFECAVAALLLAFCCFRPCSARPPRSASRPQCRRAVCRAASEKALRAEHEDEDEDREHGRVLPGEAERGRPSCLEEADEKRAYEGARHAAEAAEERRRQRLEPHEIAHRE